nr:hypothetical protein [Bradyrhizobium sp. WSM1417]
MPRIKHGSGIARLEPRGEIREPVDHALAAEVGPQHDLKAE